MSARSGPKLENATSLVLIIGVLTSVALEVAGIILFYITYGTLGISRDASVFIVGRNFFSFLFSQVAGGNAESAAIRLMTAGILVLLLTPYLRVVLSVAYFGWRRDLRYFLITLFVLAVLTASLLAH